MSKAPVRCRRPTPTGAAGRGARARRHRHNRALFVSSLAAALAVVGLVVGLQLANGSSGPAGSSSGSSGVPLSAGPTAPNGAFTTIGGKTETLAAFRGRPLLVWLVTTWCPSCQAGTKTMAQHIAALAGDGVRVLEIENYHDFGQPGPSVSTFAKALAGSAFGNPDWTFGEASAALTHTYNPKAYLDIYYLIDAKGKISYVNSSPSSTMPQLLAAAKRLA